MNDRINISRKEFEKLGAVYKNAEHVAINHQNHVWMLGDIHTDESKKAMQEIKKFITNSGSPA